MKQCPTMSTPCWTTTTLALALLAACNADPAIPDSAPPPGDMAGADLSLDSAAQDSALPDLGAADAAALDAMACAPMKVKLPPHAFTNSSVATRDQAFFDAMATKYACERKAKGLPVDEDYFFYSHAPVTLFNRIIKGDTKELKKMRWVMHVSGHFGAVWLRNGLDKGKAPDSGAPADAGPAPDGGSGTGGSLGDMTAEAKKADAAANGSSSKLFAYNKAPRYIRPEITPDTRSYSSNAPSASQQKTGVENGPGSVERY